VLVTDGPTKIALREFGKIGAYTVRFALVDCEYSAYYRGNVEQPEQPVSQEHHGTMHRDFLTVLNGSQ
jgi:hypothetical protein